MKKCLVTGANGFVGKHVVPALQANGWECLTFVSRKKWNLLICFSPDEGYLDVVQLGLNLDQDTDTIVHLAATCGGIGVNKKNPGKFIYENLQMGLNILEIARLHQDFIGRQVTVLNLGSVCMYPKHPPQIPFKEENIWDGYPEETNAPYGIAKRAVVETGIAYAKQYGLNVINLIPVNMAGEHDHFDLENSHVIPALVRKFVDAVDDKRDVVELWGSGKATREFLYAGDCAQAIVLALDQLTNYPHPINIGTGKEISIRDLALEIAAVTGFQGEIICNENALDGQPRRCLDISNARRRLGFVATTPLAAIVARTVRWYTKCKENGDICS
jgi:GDP-L-fucose synthase